MLLPVAASLSALLAVPQAPADPEQSPAGRRSYLGREVAQTMHWTGAPWLMRATREDEENGALLREWLAVQPGQAVCDLGCGNGYHTLPLAEAVGEGGVVFAVDLQPQMLALLQQRSERLELDNLRFVEATVDDPKLRPASCDLVLMVDVYHELSHPVRVMRRVREALKPNGRVVLVEFRAEDPEVPIKPEHMMSKAQVVREMAAHGFAHATECDRLPWQHAMAFVPAERIGPRFAARQFVAAFLRAAAGDDRRIVTPFLSPGLTAGQLPSLSTELRAELRADPAGYLLAELRRHPDGARLEHGRDQVVLRRDERGRLLVDAVRQPQKIVRSHGARRPFVAMHTALGAGEVADRIALAGEFGFDGVAWSLERLDEVRPACEAGGIDLVSAYTVLDVAANDGLEQRLAPVRAAIAALEGTTGMLWLGLRNADAGPREVAGDEAAAATLRDLLRDADRAGVEIALYPHHGFWLETADDALRLCEAVDHARLGVCFNLCHFLRCSTEVDPTAALQRCGPRLFAVTVNGADVDGRDWRELIQPLDQGDFELRDLLTTLDAIDFDGPVGLQGYGLRQPAREHLPGSMAAWRAAHSGPR